MGGMQDGEMPCGEDPDGAYSWSQTKVNPTASDVLLFIRRDLHRHMVIVGRSGGAGDASRGNQGEGSIGHDSEGCAIGPRRALDAS
jgi:hypothetical protein